MKCPDCGADKMSVERTFRTTMRTTRVLACTCGSLFESEESIVAKIGSRSRSSPENLLPVRTGSKFGVGGVGGGMSNPSEKTTNTDSRSLQIRSRSDLDPIVDLVEDLVSPGEPQSATVATALRLVPSDSAEKKARRPRVAQDPVYSEAFKAFWAKYPGHRKNVPDVCWKLWCDRGLEDIAPVIMAALAWQVETRDWTKDNGEYVCAPVVYLRQGKWKDEPPRGVAQASPGDTGRPMTGTEAMIARARASGPEVDPRYQRRG